MTTLILILSIFGCSFTGKVGDVECTSTCDNDEDVCYEVCETECVDANGDKDEACDTDCRTECRADWDSCTFTCDDNG